MKHLLTAALIALFALSFTIAQEQTAKKEKSTTTTVKSTAKPADCASGSKGCCSTAKESANMKDCSTMKDCPMMKGSSDAKSSTTGALDKKEEVKTADTKPAETK